MVLIFSFREKAPETVLRVISRKCAFVVRAEIANGAVRDEAVTCMCVLFALDSLATAPLLSIYTCLRRRFELTLDKNSHFGRFDTNESTAVRFGHDDAGPKQSPDRNTTNSPYQCPLRYTQIISYEKVWSASKLCGVDEKASTSIPYWRNSMNPDARMPPYTTMPFLISAIDDKQKTRNAIEAAPRNRPVPFPNKHTKINHQCEAI